MTASATAAAAANPARTYTATRVRPAVSVACSVVAIDHLPAVTRGHRDPGVWVDERGDEPHRPVAEEDVAAVAVLAPHLVGVAERVVRGVDDDLRMVVRVRPAVDADQAPGTVVLRRPGPQV